MNSRTWQVLADLVAPEKDDVLSRVLDAVPGSSLVEFSDGSAEASMIIAASTHLEATLFTQVLLALLDIEESGLSVTEVADAEAETFQDQNAQRAQRVAASLTRRPYVAA